MRNEFWLTVILFAFTLKSNGQERIRVNNSFVIMLNNKLLETASNVRLVLSDSSNKTETIKADYIPGELSVNYIGEKNIIYTDNTKTLTLKFDVFSYKGKHKYINNYSIILNRSWFKESVIILRILDINKAQGIYKHSFEVPGVYFALPGYIIDK